MFWAMDLDDFKGTSCGKGPYPLMNAAKDECLKGSGGSPAVTSAPGNQAQTNAPVWTQAPAWTPAPTNKPAPSWTQAPAGNGGGAVNAATVCKDRSLSNGIHKDPTDCKHFVECWDGATTRKICPAGTAYNPKIKNCDFIANVAGCH